MDLFATVDTSNPLFFIFDVMRKFLLLLDKYEVYGISLYMWIICFILVSMVISVFWRGARG